MPPTAAELVAFARELQVEREQFDQFLDLLRTEQEALVHGDVERLPELAQLKADRLTALSRLAASRNGRLASEQLPADQLGMEIWIQRHDRDGQASRSWSALVALAREAQRINAINGAIIETQLRRNRQALDVLQQAANQLTTYGADGLAQVSAGKREIGQG